MSVIQIFELVIVGVLVLLHIFSNFYNARCSCKLCTAVRSFFGMPGDVQQSVDPNYELFRSFCEWLESQKKEA